MRRAILLLAVMSVTLVVASGVAWALNKIGTDGPDTLSGTNSNDNLLGLGGNDDLFSLGGKDNLLGGPGKDEIFGGESHLAGTLANPKRLDKVPTGANVVELRHREVRRMHLPRTPENRGNKKGQGS